MISKLFVLFAFTIAIPLYIAQSSGSALEATIPLIKNPNGYILNFTGYYYMSSFAEIPLLIDLTSTRNVVIDAPCLSFSWPDFSHQDSPCSDLVESSDSEWPYYTLSLNYCGNSSIYVSTPTTGNLTGLNQFTQAVYCVASDSIPQTYGQDTYGTVGFGLSDNSDTGCYNVFNRSSAYTIMSIFLNKTTGNGLLSLNNPNMSYATTSTPLLGLPITMMSSGHRWGGSYITGLQYGNNTINIPASPLSTIIFDLNCQGICLTQPFYQLVLEAIQSSGFFGTCQGVICSLPKGNVSSLPDLYVISGGQNVTIPPFIYIQNYQSYLQDLPTTNLTLNLASFPYNSTNSMSATTIFGASFMSYYYTIFNGTTGTIDLYIAVDTLPSAQPSIEPISDTSGPSTTNSSTSSNSTESAGTTQTPSDPSSITGNSTSSGHNDSTSTTPTDSTQPSKGTSGPSATTDSPSPTTNSTESAGTTQTPSDPSNLTSNSTSGGHNENTTNKGSPIVWIVPVVVVCVLVIGFFVYKRHQRRKIFNNDNPRGSHFLNPEPGVNNDIDRLRRLNKPSDGPSR